MKRLPVLLWPITAFFWAMTYLLDSVGEQDWTAVTLAGIGCFMAVAAIVLELWDRSTAGAA